MGFGSLRLSILMGFGRFRLSFLVGFGRFRSILQKILRAQARVVNWRQMNGYLGVLVHFNRLDTGWAGN